MAEVTVHKVGSNRGRQRIWLDGKRLTACGFTPGTTYFLWVRNSSLSLALAEDTHSHYGEPQKRHVSGKGDKPIIDITGHWLPDLGETVKVYWLKGHISIERMKA